MGDAGPVVTEEGLERYREQLAALRDERAHAEEINDKAPIERLDRDIQAIEDQVIEAVGLGGRLRMAGDSDEKPRKAVGNAIHRALKTIEREHRVLWKHLDEYLHTASICFYRPEPPISWIT